jgi:hypothetical protein
MEVRPNAAAAIEGRPERLADMDDDVEFVRDNWEAERRGLTPPYEFCLTNPPVETRLTRPDAGGSDPGSLEISADKYPFLP